MSSINIKISETDLKKLGKKIALLKKESTSKLSQNLAKAASESANKAAEIITEKNIIDTGFLRQSVGFSASNMKAEIFAIAKYAPYHEFGTGTKVDVTDAKKLGIPSSEIKRLYKGEGKRKVNINPRPFFFPAVRIGLNNMLKRIEKDLKSITK